MLSLGLRFESFYSSIFDKLRSLAADRDVFTPGSYFSKLGFFLSVLGLYCCLLDTDLDLAPIFASYFLWKIAILFFIIRLWRSFLNLKALKPLAIVTQAAYSIFVQINLFFLMTFFMGTFLLVLSAYLLDSSLEPFLTQYEADLSMRSPKLLTFLFKITGVWHRILSKFLRSFSSNENLIPGPPSVPDEEVWLFDPKDGRF